MSNSEEQFENSDKTSSGYPRLNSNNTAIEEEVDLSMT